MRLKFYDLFEIDDWFISRSKLFENEDYESLFVFDFLDIWGVLSWWVFREKEFFTRLSIFLNENFLYSLFSFFYISYLSKDWTPYKPTTSKLSIFFWFINGDLNGTALFWLSGVAKLLIDFDSIVLLNSSISKNSDFYSWKVS